MRRAEAPPRRRALRTGAAVGHSTCAAFSGDQYLSFGLSESRRCLIWSVQTLDNVAMTENVWLTRPAPAPSLARSAGCSSATCERFTAALVNLGKFEPALRTRRRAPGTFRRLTTCRGSSTTKSGADDSRQATTTGFGFVNTQRRSNDQKRRSSGLPYAYGSSRSAPVRLVGTRRRDRGVRPPR